MRAARTKNLLAGTGVAALIACCGATAGCEDETALEEAAEDTGNAVEDAADDTGDALDDAVDETEDVFDEAGG